MKELDHIHVMEMHVDPYTSFSAAVRRWSNLVMLFCTAKTARWS